MHRTQPRSPGPCVPVVLFTHGTKQSPKAWAQRLREAGAIELLPREALRLKERGGILFLCSFLHVCTCLYMWGSTVWCMCVCMYVYRSEVDIRNLPQLLSIFLYKQGLLMNALIWLV